MDTNQIMCSTHDLMDRDQSTWHYFGVEITKCNSVIEQFEWIVYKFLCILCAKFSV